MKATSASLLKASASGARIRRRKRCLTLSWYELQGDAEKSLEAGCTAYLTKPVKKATVLAAVAEYVEQLTR